MILVKSSIDIRKYKSFVKWDDRILKGYKLTPDVFYFVNHEKSNTDTALRWIGGKGFGISVKVQTLWKV